MKGVHFFEKYNLYLEFLTYVFKICYINLISDITASAVISYVIQMKLLIYLRSVMSSESKFECKNRLLGDQNRRLDVIR